MNFIKNVALTALLTIGAFGAVMYTSCNTDECKNVVCQNGGTCIGGNCNCQVGFEGTNCETASATKFVAPTWRTTTEVCTESGSNSQYDIAIAMSGADMKTIVIGNLYASAKNTTATMSGTNTFTIASQAFGSSGTISGTGSLVNNQLIISYSVTVGGVTDACNSVTFIKI